MIKRLRGRWDLDAYLLFRTDLTAAPVAPDYGAFDVRELNQTGGVLFEQACAVQAQTEGGAPHAEDAVAATVRARLGVGDRCFVVLAADGAGAGLRWIAGPRSKVFEGFAAYVRGVPNSALFTQAYVLADYRGHRLQMLMDAHMKRELAGEGIETTYVFVGVHNLASILNCHRCNDYYRLLYHLMIDPPAAAVRHYYPKAKQEGWRPCLAAR